MKGFDEMMKILDINKGDWDNSCIFVDNQAELNFKWIEDITSFQVSTTKATKKM